MEEQIKQGVILAGDISKQLITLSTAVMAFTLTFAKDALAHSPGKVRWLLAVAFFGFQMTIIFSLWHLSALAGSLLYTSAPFSIDSARLPAAMQVLAVIIFIAATGTLALSVVARSQSNAISAASKHAAAQESSYYQNAVSDALVAPQAPETSVSDLKEKPNSAVPSERTSPK